MDVPSPPNVNTALWATACSVAIALA